MEIILFVEILGKIRAMINHEGKIINEALPSMPVEILGMNNSAYAGAELVVTENEEDAKNMAELKKLIQIKIKKCIRKTKQSYLKIQKIKTN